MMKKMSFQVISDIFCDFQLERDRPTDRPTDQPTDRASYRGAMAHLKNKAGYTAIQSRTIGLEHDAKTTRHSKM